LDMEEESTLSAVAKPIAMADESTERNYILHCAIGREVELIVNTICVVR